MPVVIPTPPATVITVTGITIWDYEQIQGQGPMVTAPVYARLLAGVTNNTPQVNIGGKTVRVITDTNGYWTLPEAMTTTPQAICELDTPTRGKYRFKVPSVPGNYQAYTLRDDTL